MQTRWRRDRAVRRAPVGLLPLFRWIATAEEKRKNR